MALNPLDPIVRDLAEVKRQLAGRSQLGHSSLENTAIPVYDGDGTERLRIGAQDDGTHAIKYVQGPPPPRPTAPVVSVDGPVVRVRWDGILMGGHIPEDFARIDVHFALATDDIESPEAVRANLATSAGNETVLAATQTGTYRVGLVAMSQSRARSEMSDTVEVDVTLVDLEGALDSVVENARGGSNYYRPEPPPGSDHDPDRDLWFDTSEGDDGLTHYTPHRWDPEAQEWVSLGDERVQAVRDAQAELEGDLDVVRQTADGKNRTYYQTTMPGASSTPPPVLGDLWFNTANGYRLHRYNGSTFVEVADGRIAEVENAVENIDISGPLSEARAEWLADAAADAQAKAQAAAAAAEAAAKLYADAVATGAIEGELEGIQDYADNAAEQARQAAIDAAIAEARVIANGARDEALGAALDADAVISQAVADFESDLDVVRQSADGKNRIVWSPNEPSGDGKAGDTWFRTSGNNIIGHWRHSGSAWVSMSLAPAVIPNLDAGKITSGYIDSARIRAGSISASKLLIGNTTNLIPDPGALGSIHDSWVGYGSGSVGEFGSTAFWRYSQATQGYRGVRVGNTEGAFGNSQWLASSKFQVKPGESYLIEVICFSTDLVGGSPRMGLRLGDANDSFMGETETVTMDQGGFTTYSKIVEVPNDLTVKWARLRYTIPASVTSGYAFFLSPVVRPAVGSTLIEDGAITADKITAGAVGATAIAAESIDASKIVAGGIQADSLIVPGTVGGTLIEDGAITTSKIEAGAITAQSGIIASLDAGVISSGVIDAERIGAASITADKILIGGAGNLLTNPGFIGSGAGWNISSYNPVITDSGGPTGEPVLSIQHSSSTGGVFPYLGGLAQSVSGSFAPDLTVVESGKRYAASVWVRAGVDIPVGNAGMGFRLRELGSATLEWAFPATATNREVIPANTWAKIEAEVQVPTTTGTWNRLAFGLRANGALNGERVEFSAPALLPKVGATLIEDGAITTEKIAAGAITAESGVIGSLDLGKATVGELNGARIEAGTIDTEQLAFGAATGDILAVDALNFKTAQGLDIRSSSFRAGDAVEITEDFGIRQFGPDGALNVSLPSDGSEAQFRGDLSARTLTATGRMAIQGPGAIASGGVLELESGVVPPVAGPQITNVWDRTVFPPLTDQEAPAGLAWADGHFWRCVTTSTPLSEGGRVRIEKITPSGQLAGGWDTSFRVRVNGITILNGELYVLAAGLSVSGDDSTPTRPRMVVVYDLNGVEQRRWEYPHYGAGTYQPGIGNDGTDIVIAQSWQSGLHSYRSYNPQTGTVTHQFHTNFLMRSDITQILFGDFDYGDGRKKIIAQQRTGLKAFVCYDQPATAPDDVARSWNAADFQNPVGLVWDGARFHSLTPTGDLVSYESHARSKILGDDEDDWWAAVTWGTGGRETTAGPATRFRYLHRAHLLVQNGDVPAGVEVANFYVSQGASEPDRTDLQWRATSEQPHEPLKIAYLHDFVVPRTPPATNTFTANTPGEIHSALGNFRVDGAGAGEWGPLRFGEDGSLRGAGTIITGQVEHPSIEAGNLNSHDVTVTFPAGRFTSPPVIMLSHTNGLVSPVPSAGTVTKDSFQLRVWNPHEIRNAGAGTVYWAAIERST